MVIAEGLVTKFHRCPSHEVLWSLVHTDPFYLSHHLPRHLWTWLNLQWGHNSVLVSGIPLQGVSSAHRTKPKVLRAAFKVLRDGWHPVSQHRASVVPDTELASGMPYLWLFLRYAVLSSLQTFTSEFIWVPLLEQMCLSWKSLLKYCPLHSLFWFLPAWGLKSDRPGFKLPICLFSTLWFCVFQWTLLQFNLPICQTGEDSCNWEEVVNNRGSDGFKVECPTQILSDVSLLCSLRSLIHSVCWLDFRFGSYLLFFIIYAQIHLLN